MKYRVYSWIAFWFFFSVGMPMFADAICEGYFFGPRPVNAILKTGNTLYLGTDNGLMVKDLLNGNIMHYHKLNSSLQAYRVSHLVMKSNGSIWIGTDTGLFKMQAGVIRRYMASELGGSILSLYIDADDIIWLGVGRDFYKINQSETLVQITSPSDSPRALCSDQAGSLWLGFTDGLLHWNPATGAQNSYTTANSVLPDDEIRDIDIDGSGNIWVLSKLGLTKIPSSGAWQTWGGNYDGPLAFCNHMDIDVQNRVWMNNSTTLSYLDGYAIQSYNRSSLGLADYPLTSVCCADSVYFGAWGHFSSFTGPGANNYPLYNTKLLNAALYSTQMDITGNIWITYYGDYYTTLGANLAIHHNLPVPADNVSRIILTSSRQNYGVIGYAIYALNDHDWSFLNYTDWIEKAFYANGKAYFNPLNLGVLSYQGNQPDNLAIEFPGSLWNYASRLTVDSRGALWFLNNDYLVSYADSTFTPRPIPSELGSITCLSAGQGRDIWIGNHDGVIWKHDGINYAQVFTLPADEEVLQIITGHDSEIWICSESGLYLWHDNGGLKSVIPSSSGVDVLQSISLTPDGRLIATTKYGFYIFRDVTPSAVGDDYTCSSPELLKAYPNPSSSEVHIIYPNTKVITHLAVYNIKGQLVRELSTARQAETLWDGKDGKGQAVPNGIYIIKAMAGSESITRRVVIRN